ncbi:TetR/AcrR family transcriptional regulator [Croceimicrobium hydrocarbonivorans]|uniref:TetR/AcrR family transcriptional regulator n=1 Tax=Croceimicrobium hydrocarbonivorans TaxID=2761580 RepID=A0A7H0VEC9_9FLAO|nr:TetR/AcrR family transcriptional regulator [Croceimicrobium hydrocarbonivorans]QNR24077.1 TetR/AcrR family transcriptional regulator [Croceimicrobium hydrocarbonivorans]
MRTLLGSLRIQIPEQLYVKDPETTDLGKRIVEHSILLINELGFECFTFRKLGAAIGSPESTIYRYFENKHKLLLYLISWYWAWLEYKVVFATANVETAEDQLCNSIRTICETVKQDQNFSHINEEVLQRIVIAESSKTFLTKEIDQENKNGYFKNYKNLIERLAGIISDLNPDFKHPRTLASTLLEANHLQKFFGEHMPSITDIATQDEDLIHFIETMTTSILNYGPKRS